VGGSSSPPDGECLPAVTRCTFEAIETCESDGHWGAPKTCEVACDATGIACVQPLQIISTSYSTCARMSDGTVRCWGQGFLGTLGSGSSEDAAKPREISGLHNVERLFSNDDTICALLSDKRPVCWGRNSSNLITTSSETPLFAPTSMVGVANVKTMTMGHAHICILEEGSDRVKCKGPNSFGQLGNGSTQASTSFVETAGPITSFKQLATRTNTVCATSTDGRVACWGDGAKKANGSAQQANLLVPTALAGVEHVSEVLAGSTSCAVREDKKVLCWGDNARGELGRGTIGPLDGLSPALVNQLDGVVQLARSGDHVCAVKEDQTVWCWGGARMGCLGVSCEAASELCKPDAFDYSGGGIPQFAVPSPLQVNLQNVVEVSVGLGFTCARTADSRVHCWGYNVNGQLGNGTKGAPVIKPTPVIWKLDFRGRRWPERA
jgi:alpha-tubulin suppressor-like RCC1 family protein